jgi:hypothetical protein
MNPLTQSKPRTILPLFSAFALACCALLPRAQAVSPPPDGGYDGGNTAEGTDALHSLSAFGMVSLGRIEALSNTALGYQTLYFNPSGDRNTATGNRALYQNNGSDNTATGASALNHNTADSNTATGASALFSNVTGSFNTAMGANALYHNTAEGNTAIGYKALYNHIGSVDSNFNVAIGSDALLSNANGQNNVAVGAGAGSGLTEGSSNIYIGSLNGGDSVEYKTIRIGVSSGPLEFKQSRTFIAGIAGMSEGGFMISTVYINNDGRLGTQPPASSRRYKQQIKPMAQTSEAVLALKPVTFKYKGDEKGTPQFGLIAEEVAAVNPDLIVRDEKGEIYSVRYEAVNAMLLNEFIKEHRAVQELKSKVAKQEATAAEQQKQIEALSEGLHRVSDQLEMSKPAPRVVVNNP